jgi:uncharacterized membrane protein YtjA (UPF0391 family)
MPANSLYCAIVALLIALVAALFGLGGIAGAAAGIAPDPVLCVSVISQVILIMNFMGQRKGPIRPSGYLILVGNGSRCGPNSSLRCGSTTLPTTRFGMERS